MTGATCAGPAWAEYMHEAHKGLPVIDFVKPNSGLIEATVCALSGKLPTKYCNESVINEIYLTGTEPREFCDIHKYEFDRSVVMKENIKSSILLGDKLFEDLSLPEMDSLFLEELEEASESQPEELTNPLLD